MKDLVLNAPYWLLVVAGIVAAAVVFSGLKRGDARVRNVGLAVAGVAALLLALRLFVPTDEKRVERETRELVTALGAGDWPTAERTLEHATLYEWKGSQIVDRAKLFHDLFQVTDAVVGSLDLKRVDTVITINLTATAHLKSGFRDSTQFRLRVEWQQRATGWLLTNLEPTQIDVLPPSETESLIRHGGQMVPGL